METALMDAVRGGRSWAGKTPYRGQKTIWAIGNAGNEAFFPVIIVPYDQVVGMAATAEEHVRSKTGTALAFTGLILLLAVIASLLVAYFSARAVTRPVSRLASAAENLAGGNYQTRVDIQTGDELEELGRIFNGLGPRLQERESMARDLALARDIQQHLLPGKTPSISGIDIVGQTVYCDETGGDYFDFIRFEEKETRKLGFAVGDVSGHGIPAALLMASARGVLRTHAGCHEGDISRLFHLLNQHLVRDTAADRFMTLFYGVFDAEDHSLCWNSAGHGPVLLFRKSTANIEELETTGVPLGITRETTYDPSGPIHMGSGDALLIGTDGLWETQNSDGRRFGVERLKEIFAACSGKSAKETYDEVIASIDDFRGPERQEDDLTLVVVKVD